MPTFKSRIQQFVHPSNPQQQQDRIHLGTLNATLEQIVTDVTATPLMRVIDVVHELLPTFNYMDEHTSCAETNHIESARHFCQQSIKGTSKNWSSHALEQWLRCHNEA